LPVRGSCRRRRTRGGRRWAAPRRRHERASCGEIGPWSGTLGPVDSTNDSTRAEPQVRDLQMSWSACWARQGSNLRPLGCERGGQRRIEPRSVTTVPGRVPVVALRHPLRRQFAPRMAPCPLPTRAPQARATDGSVQLVEVRALLRIPGRCGDRPAHPGVRSSNRRYDAETARLASPCYAPIVSTAGDAGTAGDRSPMERR
jgi:hypothetical protein